MRSTMLCMIWGFNSSDRSSAVPHTLCPRTRNKINKTTSSPGIVAPAFDEQCWMASAAFGAACRLGRGASDADISLRSGLNAQ